MRGPDECPFVRTHPAQRADWENEMKVTKVGEAAKAAARAHTDLNIFYGIIQLLEGGLISSSSYPCADRIISICKKEGAKCLRRYDRALAQSDQIGRTK
jgi:hypothetical protein